MFGIDKRRNRRRQESRRWRLPAIDWRALAVSVASLGGVLAVAAAVGWALDQPIQRVVVQGRFQRVSPLDVEQAVKRQLRGAGLVSVNLPAVRHAIESLPWVDTATVARAWPRGLQVMVTEQIAAARWGTNGLLNSRGELFDSESRHIPPELPRLSGPPGTEHEVAQRYLASQGRLVEAGMHIAALRLDARGAWQIDLDNGVCVRLGRRQVDERFERFIAAALRLVAQRAADIEYVDMRYTNGFAVGWKGGAGTARVAAGPAAAGDDAPEA
ncbi:MAG: cell division protein FtsQ/DivIB [Steroidobacteraceae bacterium]